jgi:hypothetical protein
VICNRYFSLKLIRAYFFIFGVSINRPPPGVSEYCYRDAYLPDYWKIFLINKRFGIPSITITDGPAGTHPVDEPNKSADDWFCTAWRAGILFASGEVIALFKKTGVSFGGR